MTLEMADRCLLAGTAQRQGQSRYDLDRYHTDSGLLARLNVSYSSNDAQMFHHEGSKVNRGK